MATSAPKHLRRRPILDIELLAELSAQALRQDARNHVSGAAGRGGTTILTRPPGTAPRPRIRDQRRHYKSENGPLPAGAGHRVGLSGLLGMYPISERRSAACAQNCSDPAAACQPLLASAIMARGAIQNRGRALRQLRAECVVQLVPGQTRLLIVLDGEISFQRATSPLLSRKRMTARDGAKDFWRFYLIDELLQGPERAAGARGSRLSATAPSFRRRSPGRMRHRDQGPPPLTSAPTRSASP